MKRFNKGLAFFKVWKKFKEPYKEVMGCPEAKNRWKPVSEQGGEQFPEPGKRTTWKRAVCKELRFWVEYITNLHGNLARGFQRNTYSNFILFLQFPANFFSLAKCNQKPDSQHI